MTPPSDTAQPAQAACEMRRKAETAIENAAFVTSDKYEDLARAILTYLGTYTGHTEDAPEGPWEIGSTTDQDAFVVKCGPYAWKEAVAVRDRLNRLKGDEK